MTKIAVIAVIVIVAVLLAWRYFTMEHLRPAGSRSTTSIYDFSFTTLDGKEMSLREFKGRKMLIVNVASRCGFTPQYADLERLYETHAGSLVVLGFPANDFMGQEPGTNEEIGRFCKTTYAVTFPIAQKSSVVGKEKNPVFRWLTDKTLNGWNDADPKWNFTKYLISEDGELMAVYPSTTTPLSKEVIAAIGG